MNAKITRVLGLQSWPYGVTEPAQRNTLTSWALNRQLKLSHAHAPCLRWLRTGRSSYRDELAPYRHWYDHVTAWQRKGRPAVLVAQPYGLTAEDLVDLGGLLVHGLYVCVHSHGWYGHGTTCVEIWKTFEDACLRFGEEDL